MSFRELASNAAWSMIAHLLGRGSLVVAAILLARNLDTDSFAAYSYFQLTVSMLAAYAGMGLGVTASRFFAVCGHVEEAKTPPIGTLWVLSILAGMIFALIIMVFPENWLDAGLGVPRWLLALGIFTIVVGVVPTGGALGLERYPEATIVSASSAAILIIGAIVAGHVGSAVMAMEVFVAASLVQSAGNATVVLREVGWRRLVRHTQVGGAQLKSVASFAGPMLGVTVLSASGSWVVGRAILSGPSGEHGFALYAIGLQWYALALFLPGMVSRVLLPRLVRSQLQDSADDSRALVRQGAIAALIAVIGISIAGFSLSPWLLELYGNDYRVDKWMLGTFLLAAIPSAPANTVGNAILAANGQRTWFFITICWFLLILITSTTFSAHGAKGGAWSLGVSSLVLAALGLFIGKRRGLV